MSSTTEEGIFKNIPDLDDDAPTTESTTTVESKDGEPQTKVDTGTAPDATSTTKSDAVVGSGNTANTAATAPTLVPRRDGLAEDTRTHDLVDPTTGQIVARGGIERRIFEREQSTARENVKLKSDLAQAQEAGRGATEVAQLATLLSIPPADQKIAMNLISQYYKNPLDVIKALIAEVKSVGIDISSLADVNPGLDTSAVARLMDSKIAPLLVPQQQAADQERRATEARNTLDNFLVANPDARANIATIGDVIRGEPSLSLDSAYLKMATWAIDNGLDYRQPLGPQIQAAQARQLTQTTPAVVQNNQTPAVAPLPNGRSASGALASQDQVDSAQINENTSWRDIINLSMREAGFSRT